MVAGSGAVLLSTLLTADSLLFSAANASGGRSGVLPLAVAAEARKFIAAPTKEESEFDTFLEAWFAEFLARRPLDATAFDGRWPQECGAPSAPPKIWGDVSEDAEAKALDQDEARLAEMKRRFGSVGARNASDERQVTYRVMQVKVKEMRDEHTHADFRLPFGSMGCRIGAMGCQMRVAGLLRSFKVSDKKSARCFVQLVLGLPEYFHDHAQRLRTAVARGNAPYREVLEAVRDDAESMLPTGHADLEEDYRSAIRAERAEELDPKADEIYKGFAKKVASLALSKADQARVLHQAEAAIRDGLWRGYRELRDTVTHVLEMEPPAAKAGVETTYGSAGRAAYAARVQIQAGGDAETLHSKAKDVVEANKQRMRNLASQGLNPLEQAKLAIAPFKDVLRHLHERYFIDVYPDTEAGRQAYLKQMEEYIKGMWSQLAVGTAEHEPLFYKEDVPSLACEVRRITAPSFPANAQYLAGSLSPLSPASVSFKLTNMSNLPKAEMQGLAYHETVPGHHLQVMRALSLKDSLPGFRRFFGDEAFSEGWAIYAEQDLSRRLVKLPASSDVGLLNMLQVRAIRTVVDTGLHHKNWSRDEALQYYLTNSLVQPAQAEQFLYRHYAWPGQQLSYLAGYRQIREVRDRVAATPGLKEALRGRWDASLHAAMVSHGDLPLALLEDVLRADLWEMAHASS